MDNPDFYKAFSELMKAEESESLKDAKVALKNIAKAKEN